MLIRLNRGYFRRLGWERSLLSRYLLVRRRNVVSEDGKSIEVE
jgi:hypothetical protein